MGKRFEVGMFIGRFQPFHNGHLFALRVAARSCKKIVIGIGSSQHAGTERNPLPSNSRIQIIRDGLKGTGIDIRRIRFLQIPDFGDNDKWFDYIIKREPHISVVFSRNRLVKSIFRGRGIAAMSPEWHMRRKLSATKIRKLIRSGKEWRDRVPKGSVSKVAKYESLIRKAR